MAAMTFKVPPRRGKGAKTRQKMREMLTTVILDVPTLRPSILLRTLGMFLVFALVCPVRSVHAQCSIPGVCGSETCCQDPDGTFRGRCLNGSCCAGPDGKIAACCHDNVPN